MDLSSTTSIIVGILSIGTQVFIVGSMWGKIKEKDEQRDNQIKDIKDSFNNDLKHVSGWIEDHDKYHREKDERLNDKISLIDKNVAVMVKSMEYVEEKLKENSKK